MTSANLNINKSYNFIYKFTNINDKLYQLNSKFSKRYSDNVYQNFDVFFVEKMNNFGYTFSKCIPFFTNFQSGANCGGMGARVEKLEHGVLNSSVTTFQLPTFHTLKNLNIGVDFEYTKIDEKSNKLNLSQFWINELNLGFVFKHKNNKRLKLTDYYEMILRILRIHFKISKKLVIKTYWHYGAAEFSHLDNSYKKELLKNISIVRKCPVTGIKNDNLKLKYNKPCIRNKQKITHIIRDTMLLYNQSLYKVGNAIKLPKFRVSEDEISNFDEFLKTNKMRALEYAINDAYITVKAGLEFEFFAKSEGIKRTPITASGLAVEYLKKELDSETFKKLGIRYTEKVEGLDLGDNDVLTFANDSLNLCRASYKGGINACYHTGRFYKTKAHDYDLQNAYALAMMSLRLPDFQKSYNLEIDENGHYIGGQSELNYYLLGCVNLEYFKLKKQKFYQIPFRTDKGLIFPRSGNNANITLFEFFQCLQNNFFEDYKIKSSIVFEPDFENDQIARVMAGLIKKRNYYQKLMIANPNDETASLYNFFFKLIANSLYGKFAQGINSDTPQSIITNPAIAGYITACIRMAIIEHMNYLETNGYTVFSVTTDGYLIDKKINECDSVMIELQPVSDFLLKNKMVALNDNDVELLTLKHWQENPGDLVCLRTRGNMMIGGNTSDKLQVAKNGFKTPMELKDDNQKEANLLLNSLLNEKGLNVQNNLNDKINIYEKLQDLTNKTEHVYINFMPDFKSDMVFDKIENGYTYWNAQAYETFEDFVFKNQSLENFKKMLKRRYKNHPDNAYQNIDKWFLFDELLTYEFLFYCDFCRLYPGIKYNENLIKRELALLMAKDFKNAEIAKLLDLTPDQVKFIKADFKRGKVVLIGFKFDNEFISKHEKHLKPIFGLVKKYLV